MTGTTVRPRPAARHGAAIANTESPHPLMDTTTQPSAPPPRHVEPDSPPPARHVSGSSVRVVSACTIRRPAAELYAFWRDLENLNGVVKHPVSITRTSTTESHWCVSAPPGDRMVEWDATIVADTRDELIAWQSRENSEIPNSGSIRFTPAPGDEGTEVLVELHYDPPGGQVAAWLAKLSGEEGAQQVAETLRRFKALMEAGEIPTTEGQPAGGRRAKKRSKGRTNA